MLKNNMKPPRTWSQAVSPPSGGGGGPADFAGVFEGTSGSFGRGFSVVSATTVSADCVSLTSRPISLSSISFLVSMMLVQARQSALPSAVEAVKRLVQYIQVKGRKVRCSQGTRKREQMKTSREMNKERK